MHEQRPIIMIDNFDSFTYNLVSLFRGLGCEVLVFRNDVAIEQIFTKERLQKNPCVVLSPGPGRPEDAGNLLAIIEQFADQLPILGICLGHQAMASHFGAKVSQANQIVHGKAARIESFGHPIFSGQANPFVAARYHSLAVTSMPSCLQTLATCDGEIMAIAHENLPLIGFQFHPESILTTHGAKLIEDSLSWLQAQPVPAPKQTASIC